MSSDEWYIVLLLPLLTASRPAINGFTDGTCVLGSTKCLVHPSRTHPSQGLEYKPAHRERCKSLGQSTYRLFAHVTGLGNQLCDMTGAMDGHQAQHTKPLGFGQQQQRAANNTYSLKPTAYLTLMAAGEAANGSDGQAAAELPAFCSSLPDSVTALLRLVDGVWAESGQISARSSSSSSSSSSSAKPETSAPAINVPPPGLEGASNPPEKFVRRVSRQRLLLPEQQQRLQSVPQNYHSTLRDKLHTTSPKRSVTIADPEEPDWPQVPQRPGS